MNYAVGDTVILTGDNFQVPNVGMKGVVSRIGFHRYVLVQWVDEASGWFSPYQASKWICKVRNP